MTFSSTLYASKLKSMINLSYEPRYCCFLKVGPRSGSGGSECDAIEDEIPL